MKRLILVALIGFGCPGKPPSEVAAKPGAGSASSAQPLSPACAAVRPRVEQLYRADAQAHEPGRADEAVADNTAMVMNDCGKAPDKVAACVAAASTVKDLEARCLVPLDDEGTEGDQSAR